MGEKQRVALGQYMSAINVTPQGRKTQVWEVLDRHYGTLGCVKWYGAWRQYVFIPEPASAPIFNGGCLNEITNFLARLMRERRTRDDRSDPLRRSSGEHPQEKARSGICRRAMAVLALGCRAVVVALPRTYRFLRMAHLRIREELRPMTPSPKPCERCGGGAGTSST